MLLLRLSISLSLLGLSSYGATFGTVTAALGAADMVLDQPRGRLYLINSNLNRVQVYSIAQRTFLASITTGTQPLSGAMSPDGKFLYVTCFAQASLNVIDLDRSTVTRRVSLPASPEGVAVGVDGRALITTIGTGPGNQFNTLLVYDPNAAVGAEISVVLVGPTPAAPPITPPLGRSALATRSALLATPDGRRIIGVNNSGNTRSVFVYEVASATILRARTFNFVSNVLSISPDASKFMAGLTLFETDTLAVLAQQNAANAPFSFPGGNANNFNTQQNQGGSVFAPDGSTLYSAFNIAPVQNPPARANVSRFLLNDPDNLLITLGLQLTENLAGKMVISSDGQTVFALSESGFVTLPVGTIYNNPIAMPDNPVVLLSNDQCGLAPNKRVTVGVNNAGRGRLTASAQLLQLPNPGPQGLGGFGGPGGGGPGGTIIIVLPPIIPGLAGPAGVQGFGGNNTSVLQTSPQVQTQITPAGAAITFQYNTVNARTTGTITPHDFLIQSPEAINIPPNIRIFQNNRDTEARADVMTVPVNSSSSEGLFDMITDTVRQRLYIANSGMNRVEVFDTRTKKFLAPVKVGQLPHSLALGTDGVTMYVANSGSETLSVVDLDKGAQVGLVRFTPLPFNSNTALVTPSVIASGLRGPQVIMSNGSLWRVVGNQVLPRTLNPAVFGNNTRTLPGPTQTMASTPNGEFIFLLAGNGNGYLYDASVDDWVANRTLFGNAQSNLPLMTGYYGPIAAGPRGQYFLANGVIFNQSLTQIGSVPIPPTIPTLPTRGGAPTATAPPVAAVAAAGNNTFVRFSQPVATNANPFQTVATPTPTLPTVPGQGPPGGTVGGPVGGPAGGLVQAAAITAPTIELVDVNTGNTMRASAALEGPLARVTGNQTMRISGRTLAVDAAGTTAYALTTSGLSIVPLDPVLPADRPIVNPNNGVVNLANSLPALAPGSLARLSGRNLASSASVDSGTRPTILGGACVTLNNVPLPLLLTSDQQINVQIPPTLAAGRYPLVVRSIDRKAASTQSVVTISKVAPVVFMDENNSALIYHKDGQLVTRDNPANRDEPLSILATGLGGTKGGRVTAGEPSPSNPLAVTGTVNVYFGSPQYKQSEMIVDWSGLAPGLIGVYQINIRVPGFHSTGKALPVTIRAGGVLSPSSGPTVPVVAVD